MIKFPLFGLLSKRSPMDGLMEHYEQIAKGMRLVEDGIACFIATNNISECREYAAIVEEVRQVEDKADKIKRNIRNHMPRDLFMPVDKVLYFNYTRQQDSILDDGLDSLIWLSMYELHLSEAMKASLSNFVQDVANTIQMLKPALEATITLVSDDSLDREDVKNQYRAIRANHQKVNKVQNELKPQIFNSAMDFKEIYLLMRFMERMNEMSHNAEGCADLLRAMIAR